MIDDVIAYFLGCNDISHVLKISISELIRLQFKIEANNVKYRHQTIQF